MTKRIAFLPTLVLPLGILWGCSSRLDVGAVDDDAGRGAQLDAGGAAQLDAGSLGDGSAANDGDAMASQPRSVGEMVTASCTFPLPAYEGSEAGAANCPCTRRPSSRQDALCPIGNCTSMTVTIGPAGGTIELPSSHQAAVSGVAPRLVIPANALASDVQITLTELNFSPPEDYVDSSPIYRFEPATSNWRWPRSSKSDRAIRRPPRTSTRTGRRQTSQAGSSFLIRPTQAGTFSERQHASVWSSRVARAPRRGLRMPARDERT
ncbi:MAG: hypothetical protein JWM74_1066 [Myxococcaceae bacterium]|nr:hypothetical protein [Myxococcaceae bacterium]